jgi:hypothetical protein
MILAGAVLLAQRPVEFGGEGEFTKEIAEGFIHGNW